MPPIGKIKKECKKGLPLIFNKYKKTKIFAVGLAIVIISVIALSKFVWNVEIVGNDKINVEEIMIIANENGLKVGELKNKIDTKKIINKLRLERNDLAWVGIELKGTNALIKIIEATPKPDIINEEVTEEVTL